MKAFHEHLIYSLGIPIFFKQTNNINFLAHWHSDVEMILVCDGVQTIGINQEVRHLKKGEMAICGSGDIHFYDGKSSNSTILILIFRPELIGFPGGWPENLRFESPFIDHKFIEDNGIDPESVNKIRSCIYEIQGEIKGHRNYYDMIVKSKLIEICALAQRHFPALYSDFKTERFMLYNIERMQKVLKFLEENYTKDITLEDAASHIDLSIFHFSRLFKNTVGMNFKAYVNKRRIERAETLIREGGMTITEIALECGFESIRTFHRVFKSIKDVSPTKPKSSQPS